MWVELNPPTAQDSPGSYLPGKKKEKKKYKNNKNKKSQFAMVLYTCLRKNRRVYKYTIE